MGVVALDFNVVQVARHVQFGNELAVTVKIKEQYFNIKALRFLWGFIMCILYIVCIPSFPSALSLIFFFFHLYFLHCIYENI